jgi:hypothetical protein
MAGRVIFLKMPAGPDIERLYDEHAQPLYAFLLNFTRDEADTRDLPRDVEKNSLKRLYPERTIGCKHNPPQH